MSVKVRRLNDRRYAIIVRVMSRQLTIRIGYIQLTYIDSCTNICVKLYIPSYIFRNLAFQYNPIRRIEKGRFFFKLRVNYIILLCLYAKSSINIIIN